MTNHDPKDIVEVKVTKWGKCGVCKGKVQVGQVVQFLYDKSLEETPRWRCRHGYR